MRRSLAVLLAVGCAGAPRPAPPRCVARPGARSVIVTGEVQGPGTHVAPGATIEESLALAGGPTPLAQRRRVTLRRRTADGVRALVVDLDAASPIVLCAGDVVSVPRGGD